MASQISRKLFIKSKLNDQVEEPSVMLLIQNSLVEARKKNYKKAFTEFYKSYLEAKEDGNVFISKLLELDLHDLESLFMCLFGCDSNRRSSKQHEKKVSSSKNKSAVGDYSFTNEAYDLESNNTAKEQIKSQSLRGLKTEHETSPEDKVHLKNCLRKSFYLVRDLKNNNKIQERCLRTMLDIHFRVENYYPCVLLLVEHKDKKCIDKLIISLDDTQKHELYKICMSISNDILQNQNNVIDGTDRNTSSNYCLLATRIFPGKPEAFATLCFIYRRNDESEKAFSIVKKYLNESCTESKSLLIQLLLCEIDYGKYDYIMSRLDDLINQYQNDKNDFLILKSFLLIYQSHVFEGLQLIKKIRNTSELKKSIITLTEQLKSEFHEHVVREMQSYFTEQFKQDKNITTLKDEKILFLMITQLLAIKNQHHLKFAKLYGDCLVLCGENDIVSAYYTQLIKLHENETIPMMHLASLRLKMGAYNAATEDFRTIIAMIGLEKFSSNLDALTESERAEIARIHQVRAFKHLSKNMAYQEAAECFSIAICAVGVKAVGLLLTRGFCYMHLNKFEQAKMDYTSCLDIDPTITSAQFARSVVYAVTTHIEEAIIDFRSAFKTNQSACKQCITKLPLEHVLTFAQLVIQYVKQELERVRMIKTKLYEINEIAKVEKEESKTKAFDTEVIKYCDFLCTSFPQNIDYLCTYIECLYVTKETSVALHHIGLYIKLFPSCSALFAWRVVLLASARRYDEALAELHYITEFDEGTQHVFMYFEHTDKNKLLHKCVERATALADRERHSEALIYYNVAVTFSSKDTKTMRTRMKCYQELGETKKWLDDLCEVIKLDPVVSDLHLRAKYYQSEGEDRLACEDYMYAVELNQDETIINVAIDSNEDNVVDLFYKTVCRLVDREQPMVVLRLCETGLMFNPKHKGLKQMKDVAKANITKCVIQ